MQKTYFNWSTGKDSALALYYLQQNRNLQIDHLLTTINSHHDRVSMHGLRRELLLKQVASLNIPFSTVELPEQPSMDEYNKLMADTVDKLKRDGYTDCGFGDIFLEDLRAYREKQLEGIKCHFPIWKKDTTELFEEFIDLGFKAITIALNSQLLDESFIGRELDRSFLNDLPDNVDPCGEYGEFHTFCYDGPIFDTPIDFQIGEKIYREYPSPKKDEQHDTDKRVGYWFCDLLPK